MSPLPDTPATVPVEVDLPLLPNSDLTLPRANACQEVVKSTLADSDDEDFCHCRSPETENVTPPIRCSSPFPISQDASPLLAAGRLESHDAKNLPVCVPQHAAGTIPLDATFYKRELPSSCIPFASSEGKALFRSALGEGNLENYFILASQFTTQREPAFCGLATLCMALNALNVDPKKQWKGPWRWYDEEMLDCCKPLSKIQVSGVTLGEFGCLAHCNGLSAQVKRGYRFPLEEFRQDVKNAVSSTEEILCVCFARSSLGQTGDGHFSPIGGYSSVHDMVLVLDVARFKYPPYWVPLPQLYEAFRPIDLKIGKPRGWAVLRRSSALNMPSKLALNPTYLKSVVLQLDSVKKKIRTASLTDILKNIVSHVPLDTGAVIVERSVNDRPLMSACGLACEEAIAKFREEYLASINQLFHLVYSTSLGTQILGLTQKNESVSLAQRIRDQSGPQISHKNSPEVGFPVEHVINGCHGSEDMINCKFLIGQDTNYRRPALLSLFLLSIPLETVVPVDWLAENAPETYRVLCDMWTLDDKPEILKNEIKMLRSQFFELQRLWQDEK